MSMMQKKKEQIVRRTETFRIYAKFADRIFCPSNAIEEAFWKRDYYVDPLFLTSDEVLCKPTFLRTTNNSEGRYDEEFDSFCRDRFGMSFRAVRSEWFARLGSIDGYWHWIKLELTDGN